MTTLQASGLSCPRARHRPGRRALLLVLLAAPLVPSRAAGIRIIHTEVSVPASAAALRKLLVLGWGARQDLRQLFEDAVAQALRGRGVGAEASYTRLSAAEVPLRDAVTRVVKAEGYDGVLVARLIATERAAAAGSPPPAAHDAPTLERDLAQLEMSSAQSQDSLVAVTETSLYRVADGVRVWSALTDVKDPKDLEQTTRDYASVVVAELRRHKLL